MMHPGDFIITPAWTWHDHGNPGSEPVVWMDGLDIPILALFDAQFAENYPEEVQPVTAREGTALARYGSNLAPLDPVTPFGKTSPVFSYPYARSREALAALGRNGDADPCHGWKMQFTNPLTGGPAMPTIGAFLQLLPRGFRSRPYRSTDATVYSVAEGSGTVKIGAASYEFQRRDSFVVPSWQPLLIEAHGECVLFSYSDRSAQQALGIWRELRG
jgi:gentisate 1,2-dioxygenase